MRKKCITQFFTLVELLVAMFVFSVLLVIMLQFFSGAQRIWTASEKRNTLYADTRLGMDFISTLLSNTYTVTGDQQLPFWVNDSNNTIIFATNTKLDMAGDSYIRFVKISFDNDTHKLMLYVVSDKYNRFSYLFPPYGTGESGVYTDNLAVLSQLNSLFDAASGDNIDANSQRYELLDRVMDFKIIPYDRSSSSPGISRRNNHSTLSADDILTPYFIAVQVSLLDKISYEQYLAMAGNASKQAELKKQNMYTFSRSVFIGDRYLPVN